SSLEPPSRVFAGRWRRGHDDSSRKIRTSPFQVSNPHNRDSITLVIRLLFRLFVAGPDVILLGRPALTVLLDPHLPFEDVADHGVHHRWSGGLRSRLHDDVAHRDGLDPGMSEGVAASP